MSIYSQVDFTSPEEASKWTQQVRRILDEYSLYNRVGAGTPEGAVTAPIGATYRRTDGGVSTSFYVKESGTGNTGWVGK